MSAHASPIDRRLSPLATTLLIALTIALALPVPGRIGAALSANAARGLDDFHTFYRTAGCLASRTCEPYARVVGMNVNLAPPHAHLLLLPVVSFPPLTAYYVWIGISIAAVILSAYRTFRALHLGLTAIEVVAISVAALGSSLTMALFSSGQIYAVLTWPVVEAWLAFRSGRMMRAAVLLGLAAAVKPMLLLPIPWFLLHGHRRAALVMTATVLIISAIGLLLFGLPAYAGWLSTAEQLPFEGHFRDGSVLAALVRTFLRTEDFAEVVRAPALIIPLWTTIAGSIAAITIGKNLSGDRAWLLLLAGACLVSPKGWIYAGWWLVLPAVAVWKSAPATRAVLVTAFAILWLPDTTPARWQPNAMLTPTLGCLYLWTWTLFWIAPQLSRRAAD